MRHIYLKRVSARIFATALLLMGSLSASAQYYLNVYEKSGSNNQYEIANLDSVSISDVKAIDNTPVLTHLIINEHEVNLETGGSTTLSVKGYDADGVEMTLDNLQWKSNNYSVASIDENGVVRTYKSGTAFIIASIGAISDTCVILVKDHVYTLADVVKVTVNKDTLNLETGQSGALSVKGFAFDGTEIALKNILWKSNDSSVAIVDENGLVKAQKKGTVLITASFGIISDTCTLVIVDHIYTLSEVVKVLLDKKDLNLETSDNYTLNVSGFAADGVQIPLEGIVWKSSNTSVATVDDNGVISALTKGTAFIISSLGDISDTCIVTVKDKFVSIDVTIDTLAKSGVYLGVMSFNKQLYTKPVSLLNTDSKKAFDNFIDGMEMKNGTLLCYSVDNAIDSLGSVALPDNVSKVAIVTFTDGLDQGSIDMIEAITGQYYDSDDEYLAAIKHKIKTYSLAGVPITAYSVGVRGSDVKDLSKFQSTLKQLASSDEYAIEVQNMSEVNAKFKEIASQLNRSINYQTVPIVMPGLSNGTRVRFTFDNVADATNSTLYVEGIYNRRDRTLTDVEYHGMTSISGAEVVGEVTEVIFTKFTFENILTDDNSFINKSFINEWYMTSDGLWQQNSEFDPDQQPDIELEQSTIVIMLVLDCSSSLGDDFGTAKNNAKDFISTMYSATGGDDSSGGNSGDLNENFSIYSKNPIHLSLAVSIDGIRYYLTQEQYAKANLSRATIEGLTVVFGGESFIMALQNEPINDLYYSTAKSYYGEYLPTYSQGQVISTCWSYIQNAFTAFGGTALSNYFWSGEKSGNYGYYIYSGGMTTSSSSNPVRQVRSTSSQSPIDWRDENDLTLVAYKGTKRYNFSKEQWSSLSNKGEYDVQGILVTVGMNKFVIALKNEEIDDVYHSVAKQYYGSNLPDYTQINIIIQKWGLINNALTAFGGNALDRLWSGDQSGNYGYYVYSGGVSTSSGKCSVRLVYPYSDYVDLGLSVKWATFNIGATSPYGYGDYYCWGETETKTDYSLINYKYRLSGDSYENIKFSKYNSSSEKGIVDSLSVLELSDDVARIKWGGNWRMPTQEEMKELVSCCTWTWTTINGVNGYIVTSNMEGYSGRSIFLPAAGSYSGTNLYNDGNNGSYWSSSLNPSFPDPYNSFFTGFDSKQVSSTWCGSGSSGRSIRPVCP